ncbi:hypothetical protein PPL_07946 [Heterostelium album PN500]|uniref:Uncharacterized protein n=1 Tax=Heterostelium pallidum (strain ATCC 26659 / Pp 5 / PN500) TaxID=670386 RepID=D3BHE4_HETP5|nr:hypothetical protein PPL_07946 [Heterostelium album PN500]EFA79121.1 hypothetical protein PPL_07946 [Heterostelium album PN500]|eukprot:XP_020431243.1 hypothetical protein PPL_07946 [Heterostelium album PN500]
MYKNQILIISSLLLVCVCFAVAVNPPPSLEISRCGTSGSFVSNFILDSGVGLAVQQTVVNLCYDNDNLYLKPLCYDDNIVSNYTLCNEHLYNYDVFEVFLSVGHQQPTNYLEVELSPRGVLFVAQVANTDDSCSGITDTLIGCPESEIEYSAQVIPNLGYQGFLSIPFATIQNATYPNGAVEQSSSFNTQYRMNMYRVDFPTTTSPTEYSCWSPTFMNPPCFHVPSTFGYITLV